MTDTQSAGKGQLRITLVRSTGMLSQGPMLTRALPAGPLTPMEGTQSQFPVEARFAAPDADALRDRRRRAVRGPEDPRGGRVNTPRDTSLRSSFRGDPA